MPSTKSTTKRPSTVASPPSAQDQADMAKAQIAKQMDDAKLAKRIHDDRAAGMKGEALRQKYGEWLTGPRRCKMMKRHGFGSVIGASYDRAAAAEAREVAAKEAAKAKKPARKRQPAAAK